MDGDSLIYNGEGYQIFGAIVAKTLSPLDFTHDRGTARNRAFDDLRALFEGFFSCRLHDVGGSLAI